MNELIEKARNGDKNAFSEIYNGNRSSLYKYCRNLCGDSHDTDDLISYTETQTLTVMFQFPTAWQ